ncbi:MAG TPA: adenylate kinase [Candidatus Polarisedimenticolia bacterium]|nr:adenylate kinase [Candidatus Polarisedimenticolia bacterium]
MRLLMFGAPGVGKGTQAGALSGRLGVPHLATGDMLRAAIRGGTPEGLKVRAIVERGELVPDALISDLVGARLAQSDMQGGFILDGFPRTVGQAEYLDRALQASGRAIDAVVNITVPESEIVARLGGRRVCPACGATYHAAFQPSKAADVCDACGGRLERRADDAEEVVRGRLEVYARQTAPVLEHYRAAGLLQEVDGVGSPEEVGARIEAVLDGLTRR